MLIQFVLSFILLIALLMTWKRAKQQAIRQRDALLWTFVWIFSAVIIWRPETASVAAQILGIGRGADLVVYASVIILLMLVFHLHIAHDRLERQLTEMVRKQALKDLPFDHSIELMAQGLTKKI